MILIEVLIIIVILTFYLGMYKKDLKIYINQIGTGKHGIVNNIQDGIDNVDKRNQEKND